MKYCIFHFSEKNICIFFKKGRKNIAYIFFEKKLLLFIGLQTEPKNIAWISRFHFKEKIYVIQLPKK